MKRSIWKNSAFVRLFSAYSISTFGDWFDMIAISVLAAYTWQAEPLEIAMIPVMFALPSVLFSSFAGVIADKHNKRNLMITSDLISAVLTFSIIFISNIYPLYLLIFLRGMAGLLTLPSQQALTKQNVDHEQLLQATSLNNVVSQLAKIAGPLLGAALIAFLSPKVCIGINAVSSIISAVILLATSNIKDHYTTTHSTEAAPSFSIMWKEGWILVFKNKLLFFSFLFGVLALLGIQFVDHQYAVLFREVFPKNPSLLGWVIAGSGAGALLGIFLLNRVKNIKYGLSFGGGYLLIASSFIGLGLIKVGDSLIIPIIYGLIMGCGNGILLTAFQILIQTEVPEQYIGRVFGVFQSLSSAVVIIAPLLGGLLVQWYGPGQTFIIVGIALGIVSFIGIVFQKLLWVSNDEKTSIKAHLH